MKTPESHFTPLLAARDADAEALREEIAALRAERDQLRAELAKAKEDSERLDWLCKDRQLDDLSVNIHGTEWPGLGPAHPPVAFVQLNTALFAGSDVRQAIDAARQEGGK